MSPLPPLAKAPTPAPKLIGPVIGVEFSNPPPLSTAFRSFLSPYRGHGSLRGRKGPPQGLVRSTGAAMSTAGSRDVLRGPRPSVAVACILAPSGNHHIRDDARMDPGEGILSRPPVARTSGMAPPDRHMLCRITASFRASATRALPTPDRLVIAWAQSFGPKARLTRVINTTAASYISVRASVSPRFDILPLRSISPD
jgi:hypothetical protein